MLLKVLGREREEFSYQNCICESSVIECCCKPCVCVWKVCKVVGNVSVFVKGLKCLAFAASDVLMENKEVW